MNDKQIDDLLEQAKNQRPPAIDTLRVDAICNELHVGIRRQRRIRRTVLATIVVLAIALCGLLWNKPHETSVQNSPYAVIDELVSTKRIFPEYGIAMVNGEVIVCERQEEAPEKQCLQIRLTNSDGRELVSMDVLLSENDYVVFYDDQVNGDLFLSRCTEGGESIVECDLNFCSPDGGTQKIHDVVVLNESGTDQAPPKKSSPDNNRWQLSMKAIHQG